MTGPHPRSSLFGTLGRHPFRLIVGILLFAWTVLAAFADYFVHCAFLPKDAKAAARPLWLHRGSIRSLKVFKATMQVSGTVPTKGLLISNHLGYLDVLVLASITPAVFVAKREVKSWPVAGWLAQLAGTLFVNRERRMQVGEVNGEIQKALDLGGLVTVFPEGTSWNGKEVLPFKSPLLEPAVDSKHPLTVSYIRYEMEDEDASEEICYWGDHTFFPHLLNLLSKRGFGISVRFASVTNPVQERKELARQLREEVLKLKG
jgi:1-acyl-sn-glycerol-3-phosphate acyltransferase